MRQSSRIYSWVQLSLGEHEEALAGFERALTLGHPLPSTVQLARANALRHLGRMDASDAVLDELDALKEAPGDVAAIRARNALSRGHYANAIEQATRSLEHGCHLPALSHQVRGRCYAALGDLEGAIADLEAAVKLSPSFGHLWTELSGLYASLARWNEAADAAKRAVDIKEASPDAPIAIGVALKNRTACLIRLGRIAEAWNEAESAVQRWPDEPDAHLALAEAAQVLGGVPKALPGLQAAVKRWPTHPRLLVALAGLLNGAGRHPEALAVLSRPAVEPDASALQLTHTAVAAATERARALWMTGRRDEAWSAVRAAKDLYLSLPAPLRVALRELESSMYAQQGDLDEARSVLEELGPDPQYAAQAAYYGVMSAMMAGSFDEARQRAEAFVEAHPTAVVAWIAASQVEQLSGHSLRAATILERGQAALPPPFAPMLSMRRASALAAAGRIREAEALLDRAAEVTPEGKLGGSFWGYVLWRAGRYEEARAALEAGSIRSEGDMGYRGSRTRLAAVLVRLGDAEAALALAKDVGIRWPEERRPSFALTLLELGQIDASLEMLDAAEPMVSVAAQPLRVRALRQAGRVEEAKRLAWKGAGQDPAPDRVVATAYMAAVAGGKERAEDLLEQAPASEAGEDHLWRARVHAVLGQLDMATAWLEKAHAAGYRHPRTAATDADFRQLADRAAWTALLP